MIDGYRALVQAEGAPEAPHYRRRSSAMISLLSFCLLCLPLPMTFADEATVYTKDGRRLRGEVTETASEVTIKTPAGELRLGRHLVDKIVPVDSQPATSPATTRKGSGVDEEFMKRFNALPAGDIDAHFSLAEWAREKGRFDLVARECRYILGQKPDHQNAKLLLQLADERLAEQSNEKQPPVSPPDESPSPPVPDAKGLAAVPVLSERDINRVRLYEIDPNREIDKVKVKFRKRAGEKELVDVVAAELKSQGDADAEARRRLEKGKPPEQLQIILKHTGMQYADRIEIQNDPPVFEAFRKKVLPLVATGCARSGCHTGESAVGFRLPAHVTQKEAPAYTAFLLLDRIKTANGPLIDRDDPTRSLLLDYMLPPSETSHPHPAVKRPLRLAPTLQSRKEREYQSIVDWIKSLRTPHPEYDLDYTYPDWLPAAESGTMNEPADDTPSMPPDTGGTEPGKPTP